MAAALSIAGRSMGMLDEVAQLQIDASQALAESQAKEREAANVQAEIDRHANRRKHHEQTMQRIETDMAKIKDHRETRSRELESASKAVEESERKHEEEVATVAEAEQESKDADRARSTAQREVAKAQRAVRDARNKKDQTKIDEANQRLDEARKRDKESSREQQQARQTVQKQKHRVNQAQHAINQAKHKVATAEHHLKTLATQLARIEGQMQAAEKNLDADDAEFAPQRRQIEEARAAATELMATAKSAQQKALSRMETIDMQAAANEGTSNDPSTPQEAFERARDLERLIAKKFKEFRSADLALVQSIEPSEARKLVSVPLPERPKFEVESLDRSARTQESMRRQFETLGTAERQAENMAEFAQALLARAKGLEQEGLQITLAERRESAAQERSQSAEDDGGAVSDMTSLMAKRSKQQESPGSNGERGNDGQSRSDREADGTTNSTRSEAFTVVEEKSVTAPPPPREFASPMPARRFASEGGTRAKGWTFVDSWYLIGPFDNASRANIHKQFPPESMVDLDAEYRTRAAVNPVQWRFYQSTSPKIEPRHLQGEYVIYYAWTQLHFDEPTDVWIAVGSDDRSDLWINDVRVWSSSDVLKAWKIDEGLRRVRFQAGYNKVLYRIENGNGPWAFSMCLNLDSQTRVGP
ncbi:hypothetical protein RSSM_05717 [Rhodopirellula sallentina SM41]|uniref:Uncharacterized protein n=2 Tax=Rhodopirellula TaxID=265488 RepID=M5TUX0_9BACT|nr:hypothetical protein RSSM_05717 [Rhodopirellula sallentina SM41]